MFKLVSKNVYTTLCLIFYFILAYANSLNVEFLKWNIHGDDLEQYIYFTANYLQIKKQIVPDLLFMSQ